MNQRIKVYGLLIIGLTISEAIGLYFIGGNLMEHVSKIACN
jgi:hypothetical protein